MLFPFLELLPDGDCGRSCRRDRSSFQRHLHVPGELKQDSGKEHCQQHRYHRLSQVGSIRFLFNLMIIGYTNPMHRTTFTACNSAKPVDEWNLDKVRLVIDSEKIDPQYYQ